METTEPDVTGQASRGGDQTPGDVPLFEWRRRPGLIARTGAGILAALLGLVGVLALLTHGMEEGPAPLEVTAALVALFVPTVLVLAGNAIAWRILTVVTGCLFVWRLVSVPEAPMANFALVLAFAFFGVPFLLLASEWVWEGIESSRALRRDK